MSGRDVRVVMRSRRGAVALTAAVVALTAGCTVFGGDSEGSVSPRPSSTTDATVATAPPTGATGLATFYTQKLSWSDCAKFQCARLSVPMDYDDPAGETLSLAVLKVPARGGDRLGALVVNPGGPGASGVEYAAAADFIVSAPVRRAYDVVGLDPRGVGQSDPVDCLGDAAMDAYFAGDPTPDGAVEKAAYLAGNKAFGAACAQNTGTRLGFVSTEDAARDMDILRAALRQTHLDFLGSSYGTLLGATYAGLFPDKAGRLVLDGAVAPDLTLVELNRGQAEGFETATKAYVADCVQEGDCPLGSSVEAGMTRLAQLLAELDRAPLPVTDDSRVTRLTEGWAGLGVAQAMYDQGMWSQLTDALRGAFAGNGNKLMGLAKDYARRSDTGDYRGNLFDALPAVNCLDHSEAGEHADYDALAAEFRTVAPTWGTMMAWSASACADWPVPATGSPRTITAAGSGPILVVGTTRDPATPYAWAKRLADQLENGRLLTFDGDGHTAYGRSNSCVNKAVDAYLLRGAVPAEGTAC